MPSANVGKRKPVHPDQQEFFAALGKRIKELRKQRGWSLNHMFIAFGFVPSQWQRFEKGTTISIGSMLKIAGVFEQSLGTLVRPLGDFPRSKLKDKAALKEELCR